MIKCVCGDPICQQRISFDNASKGMFYTDKHGDENLFYLDANTICALIVELRTCLIYMTELHE